jgi:hypothetical protein
MRVVETRGKSARIQSWVGWLAETMEPWALVRGKKGANWVEF